MSLVSLRGVVEYGEKFIAGLFDRGEDTVGLSLLTAVRIQYSRFVRIDSGEDWFFRIDSSEDRFVRIDSGVDRFVRIDSGEDTVGLSVLTAVRNGLSVLTAVRIQ